MKTKGANGPLLGDAGLTVVEGIEGTWHYHLRIAGQHDALCGNGDVMPTNLPIESWGIKTHLNERYCKTCEKRRRGVKK